MSVHSREASHGSGLLLRLLSVFDLQRDGVSVPLPQGCQRLLAHLALHPQPAQRARVAGTLWSDATEARAAGCLRSALWRLLHIDRDVVRTSASELWLGTDVRVDVTESYRLARRLQSDELPPAELTVTADAVESFDGDLLPDWYLDDWLVLHREQWRQARLHALEMLASRQVKRGAYAAAVQSALAAVRGDPLRESANRRLVEVHLAEGNVTEAVRAHHRFRTMLLSEFDMEPSAAFTDMVQHASVPWQHRGPLPDRPTLDGDVAVTLA